MWLDKLLMSLSRKITLVASQSNKPSHCLIGNVITIFCLLAVPLDKVMSCIGQPLCRAARHFRKNGNQSGRIGSKFCWEIFWDGHYDDEQEAKRLEKIINVSWEIREFLHFYHNSDFRLPGLFYVHLSIQWTESNFSNPDYWIQIFIKRHRFAELR